MGLLSVPIFQTGAQLTSGLLNRLVNALNGDFYLRDADGNLTNGEQNIGGPANRVNKIFARELDLEGEGGLLTASLRGFYNGILERTSARILMAANGKTKATAGVNPSALPAPVGSPRTTSDSIRNAAG